MSWLRSMFRPNAAHVLGINERNLRWIYPLNPRKFYPLADDKVRTKEALSKAGIPTPKMLDVVDRIGSIPEVLSRLGTPPCAIKPSKGKGGGGILILNSGKAGWERNTSPVSSSEVQRHLANIIFGVYSFGAEDRALIEEKIVPDPFFLEIYGEGVADLRLIYREQKLLMGMVRIPTKRSQGKANLHQGALGVGVDLETGTLKMAFIEHRYFEHHPDSGIHITGRKVSNWQNILAIGEATAKCFPLDYLGVDIAFDATQGPLVLEVNVRPGLEIQNVNQQGLKESLS